MAATAAAAAADAAAAAAVRNSIVELEAWGRYSAPRALLLWWRGQRSHGDCFGQRCPRHLLLSPRQGRQLRAAAPNVLVVTGNGSIGFV